MVSANISNIINFPNPDDYQIFSFDVFDTLVLREVFEPKDVFILMEEELVERHGKVFLGFSDARFKAELNTCTRVWSADRSKEFNLREIYSELFYLKPCLKRFSEDIIDTELRVERSVTVPSQQVLKFFNHLSDLNKTIVLVSDTYLPKEHLTQILEASGYKKHDRLYVSCEVGTNKASGKLFDVVIGDLQIDPKHILHVGDNAFSDVKQGQSKGIHTYQLPYTAKLLSKSRYCADRYKKHHFRETSSESLLRGTQKNYLLNGSPGASPAQNSGFDIGYQVLGPICYGFVTWIIQHAKDKNIKNLHFIAREGWFLKQVFDEIDSLYDTGIKSHYLYASRRALFFPFLTEPVSDFLFSFLVSPVPCKLQKYLDALELELSDNRIKELGFRSRDEVISPKLDEGDRKRLEQLFEAEASQIKALANEEKSNYLEYLDQVGITSTEQIGLVDSGWFGRGQQRLQRFVKISNPQANLFGFYLALHERAQRNFDETSQGYGYLYQFYDFKGDNKMFLEIAQMVEVFLSAPSESLKKIAKIDGVLSPRFMRETENPKLHPTVENIHAGAIAFIKEFAQAPTSTMPTIPNHLASNLLEQLIDNPTSSEAYHIGSLPYDANVLAEENEARFALSQLDIADFFKGPLRLNKEFKDTFWRSAYYKNLESPVIKLYLQFTEKHFISKNRFLGGIYSTTRKLKRKLAQSKS